MTTAAEVSVKSINIPDTNDVVELYLVDCSGREMYMEGLASHVWGQIDMLVVVYDVTREDTFDAALKVGSFETHFIHHSLLQLQLLKTTDQLSKTFFSGQRM